jgi:hypothetical protein
MAVKDWSTDYPVAQDPTPPSVPGYQETLIGESAPGVGDGDDARVSQVHALRDKLDAVCKTVGDNSNLPVTSLKATTLKNTANDWATIAEKVTPIAADLLLIEDSADGNAKKKVLIGNLPGGGSSGETTIDTPPSSPSAYDDEFSGSSLDPKWAWTGIGEPVGAGEVWGVKYGKFYTYLNGGDHGSPPGHAIGQDIPSLASDWVAVIKMEAYPKVNWHREGIFINGGSNANWVHLMLGYNGGRRIYFDRWVSGGVSYEQGNISLDSYATSFRPVVYLAISHVVSTHLFRFYWSWDGCAWVELSATFDYNLWGANVPVKIGLVMWQACGSTSNKQAISYDWFRVYSSLP